jgi:DNA-binding transcriptional ArsR family regulator
MNIYVPERRVMRILAALKGSHLALDDYNESVRKRLERSNFPLPKDEFRRLVRALEEKGLVASVFERLDGSLIALTVEGRKHMEAEGVVFDPAAVKRTRALFKEWLCKADM